MDPVVDFLVFIENEEVPSTVEMGFQNDVYYH